MANIFSLYGTIFIDNEKANKAIDDTTKKGQESHRSLSDVFAGIGKAAAIGFTALSTGATVAAGGLVALTTRIADATGAIQDSSQKVGMSAEEYQKWAYAAKMGGMEAETLEGAMIKQQKAFTAAKDGSKELIKTYKDLGINIKDVGSAGDAFDKVILKLADMKDVNERNSIAMQLFSKSYAQLSPMLDEGSESLKKLKQEAVDIGAVMSNDMAAAGEDLGDTIDKVKIGFSGVLNTLSGPLIGLAQNFLDIIITNLPTIKNMFASIGPSLTNTLSLLLPSLASLATQLLPIILDAISQLLPLFMQVLPILIQMVSSLLPFIVDLIKQLLPPILDIVKQILPVFVQLLQIILPPLVQIIQALLPALMPILQALMPLLVPLLNLLAWCINTILMPIINVITSIIDLIARGLVGAIKALTPVVSGLTSLFEKVFGGLFNIIKVPINTIIDGLNLFIRAVNKIKIPDWVPSVGGKGLNLPSIAKLRIGLDEVPYDDFPALLHRGERVMTADDNKAYTDSLNNPKQMVENKTFNQNITIEKFINNRAQDIQSLAEELEFYRQRKEA